MSGGDACQLVEEAAGGSFSHLFPRVVDRGQFGGDDLRNNVVIKSYDGDIFRYPKAGFFEGLNEYGGAKIIGNKDPVRAGIHIQYLAGRPDSGGFSPLLPPAQGPLDGQASGCPAPLVT